MGLYSGQVGYSNPSVGGMRCDQRSLYAPTDVDAHFSTTQKYNVVSLNCGINDYKQGTSDPNITFGKIVSYVRDRKSAGWNYVIVLTVEDDQAVNLGDQTAWQTYRHSLNTLIRNGAATYGYVVMDIASDPTMGCDGCALNCTYFLCPGGADSNEHPTVAGNAIFATYLQAVLSSLGFN